MTKYPSEPKARAHRLVAEGKIGGAKYGRLGGRPRKLRASELAAEQAAEHAQEIVTAFREALHPSQPVPVRLQAAKEWLAVERKEASTQLQDDARYSNMSKDEIIDVLIAQLLLGPIGTLLREERRE